eukprot:3136507-Pyramimonas_sp.AAC.2
MYQDRPSGLPRGETYPGRKRFDSLAVLAISPLRTRGATCRSKAFPPAGSLERTHCPAAICNQSFCHCFHRPITPHDRSRHGTVSRSPHQHSCMPNARVYRNVWQVLPGAE